MAVNELSYDEYIRILSAPAAGVKHRRGEAIKRRLRNRQQAAAEKLAMKEMVGEAYNAGLIGLFATMFWSMIGPILMQALKDLAKKILDRVQEELE